MVPDLLNEGGNQASEDVDVLESMFGMGARSKNVPSPSSVAKVETCTITVLQNQHMRFGKISCFKPYNFTFQDSVYDALFQKSKVPANQGSGNPPTTRRVSPVINVDDDFSFLSEVEGKHPR